ncbi:hypothetical protein GCM10022403_083720 [Streptomyces coacervatus]|uniref:Uncharacterized protein n=1 Tax=Streptomyces coacervatus TaxID=647381 RepID=A0ABP7JB23_9ACTN|nr:hypothetical protein [Streptomyces coacervatus]MDF2270274.1 hypothetical protein [Streptomyces coacervatus]
MNPETEALLRDVVTRLERGIEDRQCPAIVSLEGERSLVLSDYDYLRDDATAVAFEERAAQRAQEIHAVRWALAVPQVLALIEGGIAARAVSNLPLREGEREAITWMTCDAQDGVDYGFKAYTRRPSGDPVFGDLEVFTVAVQPSERMPGRHLLQIFGQHGDLGL